MHIHDKLLAGVATIAAQFAGRNARAVWYESVPC